MSMETDHKPRRASRSSQIRSGNSMRRVAKFIRRTFNLDESLANPEYSRVRPPITIKKSKLEDDYDVHEELGRGKFGVVKRVTKKDSNERFAAKWVKVSSQTKPDVLEEIRIMGKLNHKRVVGLFDAYEISRNMILVMEFVTGGELFERIASEESVTEKECSYYIRQLLEGLQYMHKLNIVHLDLKPENIVCISKDSWDIKLIDFGLAKELKPGTVVKTMQGTPEFVAPEVINFDPVCLASDMWSVGVIAYILVSGLSPFLGDDDNETLSYVTAAEYDFEDEAFQEIGDEAKDFIEKLLQKPPNKRKSAEECLKHEWIKKNKGNNKIKTENLKKFLAKRRWQKSVNAVRAVRRLSSMSSLLNGAAKGKSKSVVKLDQVKDEENPVLSKRELSKSTPSVFQKDNGQLSKRALKILHDSDEGSQSETGSVETLNYNIVDEREVIEGLFKENQEILEFLKKPDVEKQPTESPKKRLIEEKSSGTSQQNVVQKAKPSFLEPLPTVHTVPKGTSVLMTCTVAGNPFPRITWSRNGKTLKDDDDDVKIDFEDHVCSLCIGQCELQDEGSYTCMAENDLGNISCGTKLDVQVAPEFVKEVKDVSVEENRRVYFDVTVSGKPLPSVQWYHNNELVQEDRSVKLRKTDNNHSLVIRSVTADRRGTYKCVIANPLDSISCSARLHIQGYSDDEDDEDEVEDVVVEHQNLTKDEVDNDNHHHVILKNENIENYYDIKDEIGKGRFGVIRYGVHKATGRDYAIKYIKVRKSQKEQFQREIDIMNHLRHRRFIRLYEAYEESRQIILVLELMRGGDLLDRVSQNNSITEHEIVKYMKQILEGVKDMHEKGILHLDLKPQNIMFVNEESPNLKLIDFGLARKLNNEENVKVVFGSPEFVAPEVVNYEAVAPATDMWSVGVITYVLLSGVSPFWNSDPDVTLCNVTKACWRMPDLLFQGVSNEAKDFLTKLLVKDPSKRMKVERAFDHPWIKSVLDDGKGTNLISTERLRKYHAHQRGWVGSKEVPLCENTKISNEGGKDTESSKIVDHQKTGESELALVTKERDEMKGEFDVLLKRLSSMEEELKTGKASKREQDKTLCELQKRNKLLEERNIATQEATHRLIKLECDKKEIEEKYQQEELKLYDLSKKCKDLEEKASTFSVLEEKVVKLEKEKRKSVTETKIMEEALAKIWEENATLQAVREARSTVSEDGKLKSKVELLSKDLEIAQAEIQRLNELVNTQHEDLEEMERVSEHKRKLETRCRRLEEQLVELEEEGNEREKEIDDMEDDIADLQAKLQKSHDELRVALEENKKLKEQIKKVEATNNPVAKENGDHERKMVNGLDHEDGDVHPTSVKTDQDLLKQQQISEIPSVTPARREQVLVVNSDAQQENGDALPVKNGGNLSMKLQQLDKGLQTLMSGRTDGNINNQNVGTDEDEIQEQSGRLLRLLNDVLENFGETLDNMDVKQLRQLIKKLMKANQSLLLTNEKLNEEKKQADIKNNKLREEMERKAQILEKENSTFKKLLKAGESVNSVEEILSTTKIEALQSEVCTQQGKISDLKESNKQLEQIKTEKNTENEDIQWRLEQKIQRANNDKALLVAKYEKELEECQHFYTEEQNKLKRLCEERMASVEKQNQNLKSQINQLTNFNETKKNGCAEHVKQLCELKRLYQNEVQELEKNLALTLSQELSMLTCLSEEEKNAIKREKDSEICKLNDTCKDLNEIVLECQEQATKYPEILKENTTLKNELISEKQRYELLEKEIQTKEVCPTCDGNQKRISELENELVALRKLEEDDILLASENEKLLEQMELERQRVELVSDNGSDPETKMKLEELDTEKNTSKSKVNSKKHLKKRVCDLEKDCKDLSRKLQSEILKGKQQQIVISRETSEKDRVLQSLLKFKETNNNNMDDTTVKKETDDVLESEVRNGEGGLKEDNEYTVKEELHKSQNRTRLLQTEIDNLRENYSAKLNKELEDMEDKWTQRLRRECNAVHSEMAEELRKQKEAWKRKESQLHSVIKELQIQVEDIEKERRNIEKEWNSLKGMQNGTEYQERLVELPPDEDMRTNALLEKQLDLISDRDLRRVAYKLKKDQWSRLAALLGLSDTNIREIDQQKVGKEEKAFRVLCQWRGEHVTRGQVSTLASRLEEIRRKDLSQFVMELCTSKKSRKKLIGW